MSYSSMTSERLGYRRPEKSDLAALHELDNDPDVMRWISGGVQVPHAQFMAEFAPVYLNVNEQSPFGFWIIEAADQFIGWISLRQTEEGEATIGYRLTKDSWGMGYATEAARRFLEMGFNDQRLQRIVATTYEGNEGSQKVLEKIGMKLVRRFRMTQEDLAAHDTSLSSGEVWDLDDFVYEITAEDYV